MKSEDLNLLSSSNKFQIIIESLVETVEMYNYDVRIFGTLDPDFFLPELMLNRKDVSHLSLSRIFLQAFLPIIQKQSNYNPVFYEIQSVIY